MMAAISLAGTSPGAAVTVALAEQFLPWLARGRVILAVSPLTYEQGSSRSVQTRITTEGDHIVATMTDTQQVTVTVMPEDSKGNATSDAALVWSSDDAGAVVVLQPAADGLSCLFVANEPGTANYTVTDGTLTAPGSVVVTAGAATQLVASEGTPEDQPVVAP